MRTLQNSQLTSTSELATPAATSPSSFPATPVQMKSPWHSPVPYLFGGLAAMLGLIAFALLLLACSYWRISGRSNSERDVEQGPDGKSDDAAAVKIMPVFEEKIVVIMAGDVKPTFLATPVMSSRPANAGYEVGKIENSEKGVEDIAEKPRMEVAAIDDGGDQTSRSQERHEEQQN